MCTLQNNITPSIVLLALICLSTRINGSPMAWSEFETLNRDASVVADIVEGALMPLDMEGNCANGKVAHISNVNNDRDFCYGINSDGFLDTFSGSVNNVNKDHSCKYTIHIENKSAKQAVVTFRTGEVFFGGACAKNFVKLSGISHALGEEPESVRDNQVKLCDKLKSDKLFVVHQKDKKTNSTLTIDYKDFVNNNFGGFRGEVCFF